MSIIIDKPKLAVIGIGYVGLPLALSLSNFFSVKAYDLNKDRILDLKKNFDITNEFSSLEIRKAKFINFTYNRTSFIYGFCIFISKNKKKFSIFLTL